MRVFKDETIVVLRDECAIWCRWQGDKIVDQISIDHGESIDDNELIPFESVLNHENQSKQPLLCLIIDSSLDEIDNVVAGYEFNGNVKGRERIRESVSSGCQRWLDAMQDRGLTFDKVTSTLRLLLHHNLQCRQQKLFVIDDDYMCRHALSYRKSIVYARQCTRNDKPIAKAVLLESLAYFDSAKTLDIADDCELVYVGVEQAESELLGLWASKAVSYQAVSNVAIWYQNLFRQQIRRRDNEKLNNALGGLLDVSESRRKMWKNERKLYLATSLCVFIASITVIVACIHGFAVAKYMRNQDFKSNLISIEIDQAKQAALAFNRKPVKAAESLERFGLFEHIEYLDEAAVLNLVADAVTQQPQIELRGMQWLLTESNEAVQWLSVLSLENASSPKVIDEVLGQALETSEGMSAKIGTQISIDGSVREADLRNMQQIFNDFVNVLEASPGVSSVQVVASPLEYASSSEIDGIDYRFSLQIFHWPS